MMRCSERGSLLIYRQHWACGSIYPPFRLDGEHGQSQSKAELRISKGH
jgi:hypothetical protein